MSYYHHTGCAFFRPLRWLGMGLSRRSTAATASTIDGTRTHAASWFKCQQSDENNTSNERHSRDCVQRTNSDTVNLKPEFLILSIRNFRFYFFFFLRVKVRVSLAVKYFISSDNKIVRSSDNSAETKDKFEIWIYRKIPKSRLVFISRLLYDGAIFFFSCFINFCVRVERLSCYLLPVRLLGKKMMMISVK